MSGLRKNRPDGAFWVTRRGSCRRPESMRNWQGFPTGAFRISTVTQCVKSGARPPKESMSDGNRLFWKETEAEQARFAAGEGFGAAGAGAGAATTGAGGGSTRNGRNSSSRLAPMPTPIPRTSTRTRKRRGENRSILPTLLHHPHKDNSVTRDKRLEAACEPADVLLPPEVPHGAGPADPERRPAGRHHGGKLAPVEKANGDRSVGQRPAPDLRVALARNPAGREPERVLVHGDHLVIGQKSERKIIDALQVAADEKRRREKRPQRNMRVLLVGGKPRGMQAPRPAHPPHDEHVRVVPMPGPGVGFVAVLGKPDP